MASLERLRCDSEWKRLWDEVCQLKSVAGVQEDVQQDSADSSIRSDRLSTRPRKVPRMEDFVIMSTCGQREQHQKVPNEPKTEERKQWQTEIFYPVIDSVVGEMQRRFFEPRGHQDIQGC